MGAGQKSTRNLMAGDRTGEQENTGRENQNGKRSSGEIDPP
jgi:hypothetical protein